MRVLQSSARHGNIPCLTRNEQVSGSSPLVGSHVYPDLQEKREVSQSSRASLYRNRTATRQSMAYSRPPTMRCQALEKGCENASRHLGEQRTKEGCAAIVSS
jgi:hypothetical protein